MDRRNPTNRNLTPSFKGETDKSLGLVRLEQKDQKKKPFDRINREDLDSILAEIKNLKNNHGKTKILHLLSKNLNFTKSESEFLYFRAVTKDRTKKKKSRKK